MHLQASRHYRFDAAEACDIVRPYPLPVLFAHRSLAIPPITDVTDQSGDWDAVGQTRTIHTADLGRMRETLTLAEQARFGYTLDQLHGPMKALIGRVDGMWSFTPETGGVRLTWTWDAHPTKLGHLMKPAFGAMWRRYADRALRHLDEVLTR